MEDKTIQILRSTLEKSPELWDTRQHLAELLWASGDVQGTADVLAAAPQWPNDEANLEFAASVFAHTNADYSIDLYDAVIERNPSNARAHAALAHLHRNSGNRDATNEHYLAAIAIDPSRADPQIASWLKHGEPATSAEDQPAAPSAAPPEPPAGGAAPASRKLAAPHTDHPTPGGAPHLTASPKPPPAYAGRFEMAAISSVSDGIALQQEVELANQERKKRKASLAVAALVHVIIGLVLYFWIINKWSDDPPVIVAVDQGDPGPPLVEKKDFAQAVRQKPNPASSSSRAQVLTTSVPSPIAVAAVEEVDPDSFGVANSFGAGLGFGDGDGGGGGGSVVFFGDSAQVSRAVFVVDFSGSMTQGGRITQLKKELDASLSKLPGGVSYNVIFYSHRPWLGGENVGNAPYRDSGDANDRIPWLKANKENIQKSREEVASMEPSGGTNWIPGIKMALAMTPPPNVIWLLTDGEASDRLEMVEEMASINPTNVRINTIGMEIGGPTFESLIQIAEMTGGKFSIIINGELHTGGAARKFTDPKYSPQ